MKKISLKIIFIFILFNNFFFLNLQSQIKNTIVVKVGGSLVTSIDIENEIITNLILAKREITQVNINSTKNFSIKNLVNKLIKKNEINKYQIKNYNENDLKNYIKNIAKNFNTDINGLKKIFKQSGANYESFVEKREIELLWNTLIFQLYSNQTNINMVDVDNEVKKIKDNKNKEELKKIKENILNRKKEEKLQLFSRSHFSNLENTETINFQ